MKKAGLLLISLFILLPIAYARISSNSDDDMKRIYDRKMTPGEVQDDWDSKIIKVTPDGRGHLLVDAVLNGDVHASLTVDTGAPQLCLTADMARRLGLDPGKMKSAGEMMFLNGKHKFAQVYLKSVNLGGAEQEHILAAVFLEDDKEIADALRDGLLGLSFLNKFNFSIDKSKNELILKRLQ